MAALVDTTRNVTFKVEVGESEKGKPLYANRTIRYINPAATPDDLQPVMEALGALQSHAVGNTVVTDTSNLAKNA